MVRAQLIPEIPRLTVDPTCTDIPPEGPAPLQITARGYSLEAGRGVNLYFAGQPVPAPGDIVAVGPSGFFEVVLPVTVSLAEGPILYVDLYYADDPNREVPLLRTGITMPCPDPRPTISVTPDCGDPNVATTIRVSGSGFQPEHPIQVTVTDLFATESIYGVTDPLPTDDPNAVSIDVTATLPGAGAFRVIAVQYLRGDFFPDRAANTAIAHFVVPCSQITVEPTCGPVGAGPGRYLIQIRGSGFVNRFPLTIIFDFGAQAEYFNSNFEVGPDGTFEAEIQPYERPGPFTYTVAVTQAYDGQTVHTTYAAFTVPCPVSSVTTEPVCAPPQLTGDQPRSVAVNVTGAGFRPNLAANVTFDPDRQSGPEFTPETTQVNAGGDGTVLAQLMVLARPADTYRVVVQQPESGLEVSANFNFPCRRPNPRMRAIPNCGPVVPGQPQAYSIELNGRGFIPGQVQVVFDVDGFPESFTVTAGPNGRFGEPIRPSGRDVGVYRITATQQDARQVLTQVVLDFTVPCTTEPMPRLTITPGTVSPGFVVTVRGTGFPPGESVALYWSDGIGASRPIEVVAEPDGTFARQVVIFSHDFTGPREMTAGTTADPNAFPEAVDGLVVAAGQGSPPTYQTSGQESVDGAPIILRR